MISPGQQPSTLPSTPDKFFCRIEARLVQLFAWVGSRQLVFSLLLLLSGTASAQDPRPLIELDLITTSTGVQGDQTFVYFEQGATTGFDPGFDATKMPNSTGLNLSSFDPLRQQLAINGLPPSVLAGPFTVDLFLGVPQYANYTLQVGQLNNFGSMTVYLYDALLNVRTLLALGTTVTADITAANTNGTFTTSNRFSLLFGPQPLPVTLTDFSAALQPSGVRVSWQTASEQQSAYFAVERSPDGQHFEEAGRVAAAGTTSKPRTYQFIDALPGTEQVYYRLRQVDLDGRYSFSPVRAVQGGTTRLVVEAWPTSLPAGQDLRLRVQAPVAGPAELRFTNASGRLLLHQSLDLPAGSSTLALPKVGQWAPGIYLLQVQQGGQYHRSKVVRE